MNVITTTGFYGTGSSAITDLFSDCSCVYCKDDYEIRILHEPDAISDLEYNLIENPHRHNTSHAIKRFKNLVNFYSGNFSARHMEKYFNGTFRKYSYEFINDITEFTYTGTWYRDLLERGKWIWFFDRCYHKAWSPIDKYILKNREHEHGLFYNDTNAYAGIKDKGKFLIAVRKYTSHLLNALNDNNSPFLMVDQLVPPSNFDRYNRYVDNLTVFVVERDPRDLFLLEKYFWKGLTIPCYDVNIFCKWYKWTRSQFENSHLSKNVMKVQFEDLIFHYEETRDNVLDFANVDKSTYHMDRFNPNISIKNTRLWSKFPNESDNIMIIEKELKKYIYHSY